MYKYPLGFGNNHSNWLLSLFSLWKILKGSGNEFLIDIVPIDLQLAFSTIKHDNLLGKLGAFGFSVKTVAWFKSYLSDYAFKVNK